MSELATALYLEALHQQALAETGCEDSHVCAECGEVVV